MTHKLEYEINHSLTTFFVIGIKKTEEKIINSRN